MLVEKVYDITKKTNKSPSKSAKKLKKESLKGTLLEMDLSCERRNSAKNKPIEGFAGL